MTARDLVAVVPAAGAGSRLGVASAKLFVELRPGLRVCDVLLSRLATVTRDVHLVLSPHGVEEFDALGRPAPPGVHVTVSVQDRPRGMGDAVFGAHPHWSGWPHLLILWGDQLGVSTGTLARLAATARRAVVPSVTLPLVRSASPYVHYEFEAGTLSRVAQAREGDACPPHGRADVGTFALSTTGLAPAWERYLSQPEARGARTGELNLLPFFAHLSQREGFVVDVLDVDDPAEARGLNTPEDLAYFRAALPA